MTLGGSWSQDDRSNVNNWVNNPNIGSFNNDARRVPKMMWDLIKNLKVTNSNSALLTIYKLREETW